MMLPLIKCFQFSENAIVSFIGSGGKTSLMWYFAEHFRNRKKVLVTTTTKIAMPTDNFYDFFYQNTAEIARPLERGITLVGQSVEKVDKLGYAENISDFFPFFDIILIEADGSRQLPLKGWATFEPVVLENTTQTIGIVPLSSLGKRINETTIHRLPLFLELTDARLGDVVTVQTLIDLVQHPKGLFQKSHGQKCLYLNQVETEKEYQLAKEFVQRLTDLKEIQPDRIIAGSIQKKQGELLWEKR